MWYTTKGASLAKFRYVYWLVEFLLSSECFSFDWDEANSTKSEEKHGVTVDMIESAFDDNKLLALGEQYQPVVKEGRYGVIGKCVTGETLFICFTLRAGKIRAISARPANKRERSVYDE